MQNQQQLSVSAGNEWLNALRINQEWLLITYLFCLYPFWRSQFVAHFSVCISESKTLFVRIGMRRPMQDCKQFVYGRHRLRSASYYLHYKLNLHCKRYSESSDIATPHHHTVLCSLPSKANWWTYHSHVTWKNVANTHSCSPQSTRLYSSLNCIFISVNSVSFLTKNVSFPQNLSSEDNCKSFINSWYLHNSTHFSQKEILHQKPHFLLQKDSKTRLKQSKNSKFFRG